MRGPVVTRRVPHGVPGLVRRQALSTPDATALVDAAGTLTYRQLEVASDRVAARLRSAGGSPGDVVAVCLPRGRAMVVAMLGAMKAGLPYLPLAVDDPVERRADLVRRARARLALVGEETADAVPGVAALVVSVVGESADAVPASPAAPEEPFAPLVPYGDDHPAYVLYTSGSTGEPKGVVVPVLALCNRLLWMCEEYKFGPDDRVLQKTPYTFDVSGWELWAPLICGAVEVLLPPDAHRDPGEVVEWVTRHGVTVCHFVPSMLTEFLLWPTAASCTSLRLVVCSGEALTPGHVQRFFETLSCELHNLYGPTEAAIDVSFWRCAPGVERVLIGRPIDNCTLVVVGDDLAPVPDGEVGQLAIGGPVLATGYLHRPDLTAAAFVDAPEWAGVPRLYLTGDLVRAHADGFEYLGRRDNQVKIRGQRVEPEEIEDALRAVVREAAVVPVDLGRGVELCAFVVPGGDFGALAGSLRERLPAAWVPAHWFGLAAIPLTSSGKQDKGALRELAAERLKSSVDDVSDELTAFWAEAVGAADERTGFLDAGGHSLAAARLAGRVLGRWGVRVRLSQLLRDNVSLAQLRELVGDAPVVRAPGPVVRAERAPISPEQRRLWMWSRIFPDNPAYNVVGVLDVAGPVDAERLRAACASVLARHDVLRTVFTSDEQVVLAAAWPLLRVRSAVGAWPDAVRDFASEVAGIAFAPDRLPRAAFGLLHGEDRSAVVVSMDHLVSDQESLDLVLAELSEAYYSPEGGAVRSAVVRYPENARRAEDLRYWRERLADAPVSLDLPFTKARPAVPSFAGAVVEYDLGAESEALDTRCRAHQVTVATLVLAAYARTLSRWAGTADVTVGVPMSGREFEDELSAVGFFVKTLPVRLDVPAEAGAGDLLPSVAGAVLDAADHASVTFDEIVAEVGGDRGIERNPLFQVWFNDLSRARPPESFGGMPAVAVAQPISWSLFDVGLYLHRSPDGSYLLRLVYATDVWDADVAAEFLAQCADQVRGVDERAEVATPPDDVPGTCSDLVLRVERVAPDRPALRTADGVVTYGELTAEMRRTSALVRASAQPGELVVVRARRSAALAAAVLGCWHAGRPVLLVDADAPVPWRAAVPSGLELTLDPDQLAGVEPTGEPVVRLPAGVPGHALATSGTSGTPAVVLLPAEALPAAFDAYRDALDLSEDDVFSFTVPPAHDPVFRDLVLPLTLGAVVHVPAPEVVANPRQLARHLVETRTTVLHVTPSRARLLTDAGMVASDLRAVVCHGEPLTDGVADAVQRQTGAEVVNLYGTTETPQASGLARWQRAEPGTWQANRATVPVRALRRRLTVRTATGPGRVGEVGELTVAGTGLALGYLGSSRRLDVGEYRTGDLARFTPEGAVEVLGRADRQVSVRGHRVELAGVERVLAGLPGVRDCVVATTSGELVAWVVASVPEAELGNGLRQHLPEWSVPDRFVAVAAIPLTRNGKPDVSALLAERGRDVPVTHTDDLVELVLAVVRPLLSSSGGLTADTRFFDAGLTSMSLLRLHNRLAESFPDLSIVEVFDAGTPRALARRLSGRESAPVAPRQPDENAKDELTLRRLARRRFPAR